MNAEEMKVLVVFCTGSLLLTGLTAAGSLISASQDDGQIVRVEIDGVEETRILNELDLELLDRSGRYGLVKADQPTRERLEESGVSVYPLPGRTEISVKGHTFDFTEGGPDLDPELMIDGYPEGSEGTYIVHMLGPVNPEWREELEDMGVEILNYVPNYAYEVRMTPETRERVEELDFVDWISFYHPGFKIAEDLEKGRVQVTLVPDADIEAVNRELGEAVDGNSDIDLIDSTTGWKTILRIDDLSSAQEIAKIDDVYYIYPYREPHLHSEVDSQIIGGGSWVMDDQDSDPETAYRRHGDHGAYINQLGYTGEGVTVAVADTGIGDSTEGDAGHPDFTGRVVDGYSYTGEDDWQDGYGHGTHCTGSIAGNTHGGSGIQYAGLDGEYYASQGLAYDSELFAMKIFDENGNFLPQDYFEIVERPARVSDTYIHSNSWGSDSGGEYIDADEAYDKAVRDAHSVAPSNVPMVITASAGNAGSSEQTTGSPANAKNVITVGGTESYMPDSGSHGNDGDSVSNPDNIADFSSRGWTIDNRVKPDIVAPGKSILSTSTPEVDSSNLFGLYSEDDRYEWCDGTSMSNPAVAGAAAVVVQWYEENYGETPSPAMVKSLLINTAHDLDDANGNTDSIPNQDEGWGMVDLSKLEYPKDDPVPFRLFDQPTQLQTGEVDEYQVMTGGNDEPLKMSLVWTDKNAQEGDDPALKNDLNLELESPSGEVYRGNAFSGGWTQAGEGAMASFDSSGDGYDDVNNVENIYIPSNEVEEGVYNISVEGFNVPEDANDDGNASQDYALTVYNAPTGPDVEIISPESEDVIRRSNFTVEWTSERAENHEVRLNDEEWIDVGMNTTYTFEDVEDWDNHRVEVRAIDFLGENTTESVTFSVWTVGVEVRSPEEGKLMDHADVTIEWRSEHAEYHEVRLDESNWTDVGSDTEYSYEGLDTGEHTVVVRATDLAGYQSTSWVNFSVDTDPPELEITAPEDGYVSPERDVTIEWEGEDEVSGIDHYEVRLDEEKDGSWTEWEMKELETEHEYSNLDDGEHSVEVRVTDKAGHQENYSIDFLVDTVDPLVVIYGPENGEKINQDTVGVNWTADDKESAIEQCEIRLDEGNDGNWTGWMDIDEGEHTLEGLEEGEHTLEIRAEDLAGNEKIETITFTVDTIPPELEITSPSEDGELLRTDFVEVEWESEAVGTDIARYEIRLNDGEWKRVQGTSYTFEDVEDGDYTVEIRAVDEAGNNQTKSIDFQVDHSIIHIYWAQYWWLILPILIIVAIIVAVGVVKKVRGPKDEEETPSSEEPMGGYEKWTRTKGSPKEGLASSTKGASASAGAVSTQRSKDRGESCPTCGSQMQWYGSTKRWYCPSCQEYKGGRRDKTGTRGKRTKVKKKKKVPRQTQSKTPPPPSSTEESGRKKRTIEEEEDTGESECPLCGIKVDPDAEECWACGHDLTEEE
ncbi:MAG: S8 family serine peptidase [Candidatus Natronoplasma sp.]